MGCFREHRRREKLSQVRSKGKCSHASEMTRHGGARLSGCNRMTTWRGPKRSPRRPCRLRTKSRSDGNGLAWTAFYIR
uniref:Uncharacterized protein n=1 Tax=uncultured marine virus TaxID=186617 RepID=A0A0F7L3U3_9VIRU|nr:hypothetical protein [uncultured marine virus]